MEFTEVSNKCMGKTKMKKHNQMEEFDPLKEDVKKFIPMQTVRRFNPVHSRPHISRLGYPPLTQRESRLRINMWLIRRENLRRHGFVAKFGDM